MIRLYEYTQRNSNQVWIADKQLEAEMLAEYGMALANVILTNNTDLAENYENTGSGFYRRK
jgi:hypothetical protein